MEIPSKMTFLKLAMTFFFIAMAARADVNQKLCQSEPDTTDMAYGDIVHCEIAAVADVDAFRFTGQVGEKMNIHVLRYTNNANLCFRVIEPDQTIGGYTCMGRSIFGTDVSVGANFDVGKAGVHTIQVVDSNNDETARYGITIQRLFPSSTFAKGLGAFGLVNSGAIVPRGDQDFYQITGNNGDTITVVLSRTAENANMCFSLIQPNGVVVSYTCAGRSIFGTDASVSADIRLTQTGSHFLHITDASFDETFSYNVNVQCIGVCPAQPPPPSRPEKLRFVPLTPCRVMETRAEYNFEGRTGPFGPPYMRAGETRTLLLPNSNVCQIPAAAKAYVVNVTLVPRPPGNVDFVTVYPGYQARPDVWTVRSPDGQIVANSAIVEAARTGAIDVYTASDTDIIIDIAGYFTDSLPAVSGNTVFYPLAPCRVLDTRILYRQTGPFGPPTMSARETRRFRFPASGCPGIPANAAAYAFTITVAPPQPLAFLTAWGAGGAQPNVSSINSLSGRILANSVVIPPGGDGSLDVFVYDRTDVILDITGYFGADDGATGLYYYPVPQRRFFDSRAANGQCGGPQFADTTTRTIPVATCASTPTAAKAYQITATALPNGSPMPFLTGWPTGQPMPNASFLNAFEGQVVSNSAIIPAGTSGSIDLHAFRRTHVAVDIAGYFGR
ncbi:MAG: hypothetical protein HY820_00785 [Acidobacteria bacterium]|nr:hypothetical protein [Acidobacteriota bacterium]